ncbi:EAL domain-containing protein [Erwinia sp. MMLR14_017]|uniref:sensor domain-containing phosphodiesterase n=1 Tax=Erwinia sp. MMLR14_017 TaxID=3093842 RepID=UPI00299055F1|nr:EAL domain-containing protein [Erwinia sp. MMLR14_017]MDW8847109.1 EAL domain-containing protein [Erwinia sp. MMLR14_017]
MRTSSWIARFSQSSSGLPLILPLLLMPLSTQLSVRLGIESGYVYLIYLPLAMHIAFLLVFGWRAMPGLLLVLSLYYFQRYSLVPAALIVLANIGSLALGWKGYKLHAGRRWNADYGGTSLMKVRLLWLAFLTPLLFILCMQAVAYSGFVPRNGTVFSPELFTLHILLNFQSLLLSCLTMIQVYYFAIRCLRKPRLAKVIFLRIRKQAAPTVSREEVLCWSALVAFLLVMLFMAHKNQQNLLASDYGLPLILPLMLWSAMRFGYLFTSLSWAVLLVLLYQLRDRFLSYGTEPYHLAVMSANLLVFSLTILLMASISTRQRQMLAQAKQTALRDPVFNLPNLRALSADLAKNPLNILCFFSVPDLDRLSRIYGLRLRINYKRGLAAHLGAALQSGEEVYQLPGFDLVIRLNYSGHHARIETITTSIKAYHLQWEGLPIHPEIGFSYCSVRRPVTHLYELLGEMSAMAEQSLKTGMAENLLQNNSLPVQRRVAEKVALLNEIKTTLSQQGYPLWVQRVKGIRGDDFYAITLRMHDRAGKTILPAQLEEFGLTWDVDRWMIEQSLAFIDRYRRALPGSRFAIPLFISTLCRPRLAKEIAHYLDAYRLEPWQLIVQVPDSPLLSHASWGCSAIAQLRLLGCAVAITEFGSKFASYASLPELEGDLLKIDARFVENMLQSSLDYQVIQALCVLAKSRKMQVIAGGVSSQEVEEELRRLGVDYLQGESIGGERSLRELIGVTRAI